MSFAYFLLASLFSEILCEEPTSALLLGEDSNEQDADELNHYNCTEDSLAAECERRCPEAHCHITVEICETTCFQQVKFYQHDEFKIFVAFTILIALIIVSWKVRQYWTRKLATKSCSRPYQVRSMAALETDDKAIPDKAKLTANLTST
ncbi:hypothetical protein WR25_08700 [Diploscapter pachys]|uniref:Uncharacterized protein n=1 Tax=Diploscapter pachys TaxID=2018661 RepID=A0A2A2L221_9BILA|nr:hypothetical protein WR25_08700 [Diploscapter pachys]